MIALAIGSLWLTLSIAAGLVVSRRYPQLASVSAVLGLAVLAIFLTITFLDMPYGSGTDEVVYHSQASGVRLSLVLTGDITSQYASLDQGKYGWPTVLGVIYWLAGNTSPYLGVFINANLTFITLLLAAAAGQRLYPRTSPGPWHTLMLVASPTVLIFGASLLREASAWLAVILSVHALLCALRQRKVVAIGLLLAAVGLAMWVRTPLAVIITAAFAAAVVLAVVFQKWGLKAAIAVLVGSFAVGLKVLVPVLATAGYSPSLLLVARDYLASISTTGFVARDPFTPAGMVEALVRVGFGPLPWEYAPAAVWVWVLGNQLYWLALVVVAVLALRRWGLDPVRIGVVALCTVLLAGIAVGLTNYGIVVRMRGTLVIAVLPLAWGGLSGRFRKPAVEEAP